MITQERINEFKIKHEKEMNAYSQNVKSYVAKYSNDKCDYLIHQVNMANYHRGAVNVMIELSKSNR